SQKINKINELEGGQSFEGPSTRIQHKAEFYIWYAQPQDSAISSVLLSLFSNERLCYTFPTKGFSHFRHMNL
uniref:hypothetical protein n=1 Tax=Planktotalea sp. TaxID=2029877 RepID=UPI003D6AF05F